ncbi:MAG: valine--tRNA ligase [Candidatus Rokubacteria bacterium]|nr:valine--tRNA ligase [Candidatus Rokubacteria bacterium]MBI4255173.1 valine--tRNA ligase [Candidatus Rokubacteria bacterium]
MTDISDRYEPAAVEARWYPVWEARGYFRGDASSTKKPFSIVIPPPNVTGSLHMGHALDNTLQDIVVRMKRMDGFNTLWQPGTDHAGIATQVVVERQLAAEGRTKDDLGREAFLERVWQWKEESGGTIIRQLKRLGASCDWSRERFTMDPGLSRAVREVFVRLYRAKLIYRDDYIVNWCPRCQTVLSDLEVEREERDAEFVYIKYGPLTLGTVRPETKLGDTGLAVHPRDARYRKYVGRLLEIPSVQGTITVKVVADAAVDPKFGTGVIKVTPGHDPVDFEIGRRHKLPIRTVIGFDGKMTAAAGRYAGLDRFECRKQIVEDMKALGLIERIEPYRHAVGVCYRCKTVVEPLVSKQWYVNVKPLARKAVAAVRTGRIRITPRSWTKTYYHWMKNIRPWCISRQLWWGHRIPAWYCERDGSVHVSRTDLTACPRCKGPVRQDPDVLDTWFSSGLWPFSTLGWPERTPELRTFYPTSLLVTGYDILFFWVARMAMLGLHLMRAVPFRDVYIHTLVRDPEGQKMSKTKGNVVDPLVLMDRYGTDALRFTLAGLAVPSVRDVRITDERIEASRNFANKLWNASRLVLSNLDGYDAAAARRAGPGLADRWIEARLAATTAAVRAALRAYRFNDAAATLYQFVWSEFCDWYLEIAKLSLYHAESPAQRLRTQHTLVTVLEATLRLLHPFMPFITEELWQRLPHAGDSIVVAPYPRAGRRRAAAAEREMEAVMAVVTAVRNIRGEMRIAPGATLAVTLRPAAAERALYEGQRALVEALGRARLTVDPAARRARDTALAVAGRAEVYVDLAGVVDVAAERQRLDKEIKRAGEAVEFLRAKLARPEFVERAPAEIVAKERERLAEQEALRAKLAESLAWIGDGAR